MQTMQGLIPVGRILLRGNLAHSIVPLVHLCRLFRLADGYAVEVPERRVERPAALSLQSPNCEPWITAAGCRHHGHEP